MANKLYEEENIRDIAVAIREKNGTENTYNVSEMADAVRAITTDGDGITPSGSIEITTNGTHDITEYAEAVVNVPTESEGITPSGDITITENGSHDVTNYANAIVNVSSNVVTVTGGTTETGLPANIVVGTFTLEAETNTAINVEYEFNSTPLGLICMLDTIATDYPNITGSKTVGNSLFGRNEVIMAKSTGFQPGAVEGVANVTTSGFTLNPRGESYPFPAGTYHWIAWT